MDRSKPWVRAWLAASILFVFACQDSPAPTAPPDAHEAVAPHAPGQVAAWFARSSSEVLALPQTVFAARDEATGLLVFGVEHAAVAPGVRMVMARLGIPESAWAVQVVEPIHFMNTTLRTRHRPTVGGIQIHFGQYLCTLGFNVDHAGGRSFITNSHCTNKQGEVTGTLYYQPTSGVDPAAIGTEVDDPAYGSIAGCPVNRKCRWSDAARVLYDAGTGSSRGVIAKTTGVNSGSLDVAGSFTVTAQNNTGTSFSGTIHKVGRTTGWTSGTVTSTCANVNVSGSNIQLRCQTLVQGSGQIVGPGDSGSPAFRVTSGDNVELVGILWGGSSSGDLFVFSPLKNVQDELGSLAATSGGSTPPPTSGTVTGTVRNASTNAAIAGAMVSVQGTTLSATTGSNGTYTLTNVPAGTRTVTASAQGYESQSQSVNVTAGESVTQDFSLTPQPTGGPGTVSVADISYTTSGGRLNDRHLSVHVSVVNGDGQPVSGASVSIRLDRDGSTYGTASGTTNSSGVATFSFNNAPSGTYTTTVTSVSANGLNWDNNTPTNSYDKP